MRRITILVVIAAVLLGGGIGAGYRIGYSMYMPEIVRHVGTVNALTTEVTNMVQLNSSLEQTITQKEVFIQDQESQISGLEAESANLGTQIDSLEEQNVSLEYDLDEAREEIGDYKQQLSEKSKNIINLGNRLNEVLSIDVPQYYKWNYNGTRELNVAITLSSYVNYSEKSRARDVQGLVDMITESKSDPTIKALVNQLREIADTKRYNDRQLADYVASFVQSMPYTVDYETKGRDEYPRYPVETLFERGGDCEDTSVLIACLLDSLGIEVILLYFEDAQHIAVGVDVPLQYGYYFEFGDTNFWFLETTAEGWRIGDIPPEFQRVKAIPYPMWLKSG